MLSHNDTCFKELHNIKHLKIRRKSMNDLHILILHYSHHI